MQRATEFKGRRESTHTHCEYNKSEHKEERYMFKWKCEGAKGYIAMLFRYCTFAENYLGKIYTFQFKIEKTLKVQEQEWS